MRRRAILDQAILDNLQLNAVPTIARRQWTGAAAMAMALAALAMTTAFRTESESAPATLSGYAAVAEPATPPLSVN